jgi:hypothetical protein
MPRGVKRKVEEVLVFGRGRFTAAPDFTTKPCTNGKHHKCYSLKCACDCHKATADKVK